MTYLPLRKPKSGLIERPRFIIGPCRSRPWTSSSDLRRPDRASIILECEFHRKILLKMFSFFIRVL